MRTDGEPLGSGRSADVYALDERWVLRRYRDGADATDEAAVLEHLAAHGYPVPRVRPDAARAARGELVLQRLAGPTLLQALERGAVGAEEVGATLAALLRRLHALPPRTGPGAADRRVLHLDLHPDNVVRTPAGPVVIDWRNTEEGPPGLDWAMAALVLAQAANDPGEAPPRAAAARDVLAALLRHRPAAGDEPRRGPQTAPGDAGGGHLAEARARRATDPATPPGGERVLDLAVRQIRELVRAAP